MHGAVVAERSGPKLGRLGPSLGYNLRVAQLRIIAAFATVAERHEITPTQFAVLLLIEANPGIKQIELAGALDVDRSTLVRLVDRSADAKLVRRGSSKLDRRVAPPVLTARGRALLDVMVPAVARAEAAAAGLSAAEIATLLQLLGRIGANGRT